MRITRTRAVSRLLPLALAVLLAAGCSTAETDRPNPDAVHVQNCGRDEAFDHPPQRVVSLNQHATEILVALGLGDRLVGTAYPDDTSPPPDIADQYNQVPLLATKYPSREQILAAEPDLVVGGYASAFDSGEGRGRQDLEDLGIHTMLLSESCAGPDRPAGMDTLLADIHAFGRALGLRAQAERLAGDIRGRVQAVQHKLAQRGATPLPVMVYDNSDSAVFTLGGQGVGNDMLARAGLRNVFADVPKVFADVSWEQVAARAPQGVVFDDYVGAPVATKQQALESHPLAAGTPGVRQHRYATVPLVDLTESIRFPDAVERLAREFHGVGK